MIPIRDDNPTVNKPVATYCILGVNVLCWFLIQGAGTPDSLGQSICQFGFIPSELIGSSIGNIVEAGRCAHNYGSFGIISSMFMHGSWMHIIGNMWFLWVFGDNVEDAMGSRNFIVFYLLSGIAAALAQYVSDVDSNIPMVGASGAIGGVMGAYLVLYPRVMVHILVFFFVVRVPATMMLLYWIAVQILGGITSSSSTGGTAFWAHVGGFLAGAALVNVFKDRVLLVNHPYHGWKETKTDPFVAIWNKFENRQLEPANTFVRAQATHSDQVSSLPQRSINGAYLREMQEDDIDSVLAIIESVDSDDSEEAGADYSANGLENQFVFCQGNEVIGVTGFRAVEATDKTAWLSWTYLKQDYRGRGLGQAMLDAQVKKLKEVGCRKVFVKISDYREREESLYGAAYQLYQKIGFREELIATDFYDEGEHLHILSLDLKVDEEERDVIAEMPHIVFESMEPIADTESAYTFTWKVPGGLPFAKKRCFTAHDLNVGLRAAKNAGASRIFLTFPSNLPLVHGPLHSANFKFIGKLKDYYENGVDELHFCHDLANI